MDGDGKVAKIHEEHFKENLFFFPGFLSHVEKEVVNSRFLSANSLTGPALGVLLAVCCYVFSNNSELAPIFR